jgi:anthranilate phosphoribosyltransferase
MVGGLSCDFASAVGIAGQSIESGEAMQRLEKLVKVSND